MSSKYVELFDKFCAVCLDKDVDKVMKLFADDAEVTEPGLYLRGKQAIRDFIVREAPKFDDYVMEKLTIFEKPDQIAIEWRNRYKYEGKAHNILGMTVIDVKDGKIKRMNEYLCIQSPSGENQAITDAPLRRRS